MRTLKEKNSVEEKVNFTSDSDPRAFRVAVLFDFCQMKTNLRDGCMLQFCTFGFYAV